MTDEQRRLRLPEQAMWEIFRSSRRLLIDRAVRRLPDVERCHVNKWGDGGAHLHVAFLGRPSGMLQLRGSCLTVWEDMLPPVPAEVAEATMFQVAQEPAQVRGRAHQ